ncbi:MAG: hypothetical protein ABI467_10390 [Kofleriaceae bacterium]
MTPHEIRALLEGIEAELPVGDWQVGGVPVWPVFRIWFVFAHDPFAAGHPERPSMFGAASRVARNTTRYAGAAWRDRGHRDRGGQADAVFFTHTTCRVFQVEGRWYDQFCEPIAELLATRGLTSRFLEHAPDHQYRVPRSHASQLIQPALSALALLARAAPVPGERELAAYFARHHPALQPSFTAVRKNVAVLRLYARYFARELARIRPRLGFVVNYYDLPAMAFVLACRELGIRTVDIQHGIQGELHMAYSHWNQVPAAGYAVLPSLFWCWSEDEAREIRAWSEPVARWHRPLVGGNLVLDKFMHDDDALVKVFDREVSRCTTATNVLVTLRPRGGVPLLVRAAIEASPRDWTWWIRLHPAMLAERAAVEEALAGYRDRRIVIEEATRLPLYAVLRHMNAHLTEISSTVLEADRFGVPSVLCHPTGVEYYAALVRGAIGAFTAAEIVAAIQTQLVRPLPRRPCATIGADELAALVAGAS